MKPYRVDILIQGFVDESNLVSHGLAQYRPTITLIRASETTAIVDPGTVESQSEIASALAREGLTTANITHVIHTHHHLDHNRNTGMFPDVPVLDAWATWQGTNFITAAPPLPDGVYIERTPGHTYDSITIFVPTGEGIVAICGDVFWWEGDTQSDVYAEDRAKLAESRQRILSKADSVIPGHGPRFAVNK